MDGIILRRGERRELNRWARGQSRDAAQARRARLILLLADGERYGLIRDKLDCDTNFIARWKSRFVGERLAGLYSRHAGRAPEPGSEGHEARILKWTTQKKPADGSTHWSSRKLSLELGDVSHMSVARVWAKHGHQTASPGTLHGEQ
jgi:transposase